MDCRPESAVDLRRACVTGDVRFRDRLAKRGLLACECTGRGRRGSEAPGSDLTRATIHRNFRLLDRFGRIDRDALTQGPIGAAGKLTSNRDLKPDG